jgi:hypothetical protein
MPLAILLLVVIACVLWMFNAAGRRFLPAFAHVLTEPRIEQGPFSVFSGTSFVSGEFRGRQVAIRLQSRRGRHHVGYLVIAVGTDGPSNLDASAIDARVRDEAGGRALLTIARHDLLLSVEDGWLKTMWKPVGFVVFPGQFSEE